MSMYADFAFCASKIFFIKQKIRAKRLNISMCIIKQLSSESEIKQKQTSPQLPLKESLTSAIMKTNLLLSILRRIYLKAFRYSNGYIQVGV